VFLLAVPHTGQLGYGQASQEQVLDEASDHSDIVQVLNNQLQERKT